MVFTKKDTLTNFWLAGYVISFPFGQLARLEIALQNSLLVFYPTDIFALVFIIFAGINFKKNKLLLTIFSFVSFSFVLNLFIYHLPLLPGVFYILRLAVYLMFWFSLADYVAIRKLANTLNGLTLAALAVSMLFGWLQYVFLPDLRFLYSLGWDDHLYRLAGTFFDPGFAGILLVFGFLLAFANWLNTTKYKYLVLSSGFFVSVGFTYSRASMVAMVVGLVFLLVKAKKYLILGLMIVVSVLGVFLLPEKQGEGTNLARLFSINLRLKNYHQTYQIFTDNPVFGVGYNNICYFKPEVAPANHGCFGADNGFVFVAATLGVLGVFIFAFFGYLVVKSTTHDYLGLGFIACLMAWVVHLQFTNSIFYPWVLGILGLQFAVTRK